MNNTIENKKNIYYVTYIRACAAIMIFFCHIFGFGSIRFGFLSQLLNIGVNIFFILSGFLFGIKGNQDIKPSKWYAKRIKRIYIPYEMFLIILGILYLILDLKASAFEWVTTIIGIQGFKAVEGAEHAWYITAILICYLFTPLISKLYKKLENKNKIVKSVVILILLLFPVTIAFLSRGKILFASHVAWYSLAYILGHNYEKISINAPKAVLAFFVMITMFGIRLVSRMFLDGTILYNHVIVGYTQYIASFCIMAIFVFLFSKRKPNKIVKFINDISFEIYLYHCLFIASPLVILGKINILADTVTIAVITLIISYAMNKIYKKILSLIEKR